MMQKWSDGEKFDGFRYEHWQEAGKLFGLVEKFIRTRERGGVFDTRTTQFEGLLRRIARALAAHERVCWQRGYRAAIDAKEPEVRDAEVAEVEKLAADPLCDVTAHEMSDGYIMSLANLYTTTQTNAEGPVNVVVRDAWASGARWARSRMKDSESPKRQPNIPDGATGDCL